MRCGTRLTTWGRNTGSAQTWPTPCVAWPRTCGSARSSMSPTGWWRRTSRSRSSRRKAPWPVRLAGRNKSLQRGQTPLKSLRRRPMKSHTGAGLFIAVLVVGLAQAAATAPMAPPILVSGGFQTPESIFYEARSDIYLVSNINGDPTAADGNGFISRVAPDGRILELKWIDGTRPGVRLNAPKGMAVAGDTLYVSDITAIRMFDLRTGAPKGAVVILGSTFLNYSNVPITLLGSSDFSAQLAAALGLPFAFAAHFAPDALYAAAQFYRQHFQPSEVLQKPYLLVAVPVVAAGTDAAAQRLFTAPQQR